MPDQKPLQGLVVWLQTGVSASPGNASVALQRKLEHQVRTYDKHLALKLAASY